MNLKFLSLLSAAAAAVLVLSHGIADASPITKTFEFEASGFVAFVGTIPPEDPVSGSFSFTFDDAAGDQTGITPEAVNLTIDGFTYSVTDTTVSTFVGAFIFGGVRDGALAISGRTDDFTLVIDRLSPFGSFSYAVSTINDIFSTSTVSVTELTTVPEPGSLTLSAIGALALLASRRRYVECGPGGQCLTSSRQQWLDEARWHRGPAGSRQSTSTTNRHRR
jgi:hypothetical protein